MKRFLKKILVILSIATIITISSTSEYFFGNLASKVMADTAYSATDIKNAVYSQDEPNIFLTLLSDTTVFVGELMENLLIDAMGTAGTPTIDSIVFNEYLLTRIDYFRTGVTVDSSEANTFTITLKSFVSNLYVTLVAVVTVIYIFILVYVGVRVVMTSVADQQAKYKQMLSSWAIGLLLLFTFHYILSYVVEINDLSVNFIRTNFASNQEANENIATLMDKLKKEGVETTYKKLTQKGKETVGNEAAKIDNLPNTSEYFELYTSVNIVKAIVWIALLSKTILIAILYIKRLIMITFLILIFPFITIAYVLDRVKEGKSKVFDTWFRAFFTNVFINLLHAITFVVVVQMALRAEDWGWILPVVAILVFDKLADQISSLLGISDANASISSQIKATVELSSNMIKDIKAGVSGKISNSDVELRNEIKTMGSMNGYLNQNGYSANRYSINNGSNQNPINSNPNVNANISSNGDLNAKNTVVSINSATIDSASINSASSITNGGMAGDVDSVKGILNVTSDMKLNSTSNVSANVHGTAEVRATSNEKSFDGKAANISKENITVTPSVNVNVKSAPKVDMASVISGIGLMGKSVDGNLLSTNTDSRKNKSNRKSEKEEYYSSENVENDEADSDDYMDTVLRNSGIDPKLFSKEEKEKIFNQQIESYKRKSREKLATLEKRKNRKDDSYININTNISDID